ncbi:hypothetical protein WJX84_010783 [Apatococcus fuscideae]|uniref:Uncharacterized protein n=1 Tax=Apatococcus fuscideae TaxID=2026836 RepID=A0AAW1T913_9CHLO
MADFREEDAGWQLAARPNRSLPEAEPKPASPTPLPSDVVMDGSSAAVALPSSLQAQRSTASNVSAVPKPARSATPEALQPKAPEVVPNGDQAQLSGQRSTRTTDPRHLTPRPAPGQAAKAAVGQPKQALSQAPRKPKTAKPAAAQPAQRPDFDPNMQPATLRPSKNAKQAAQAAEGGPKQATMPGNPKPEDGKPPAVQPAQKPAVGPDAAQPASFPQLRPDQNHEKQSELAAAGPIPAIPGGSSQPAASSGESGTVSQPSGNASGVGRPSGKQGQTSRQTASNEPPKVKASRQEAPGKPSGGTPQLAARTGGSSTREPSHPSAQSSAQDLDPCPAVRLSGPPVRRSDGDAATPDGDAATPATADGDAATPATPDGDAATPDGDTATSDGSGDEAAWEEAGDSSPSGREASLPAHLQHICRLQEDRKPFEGEVVKAASRGLWISSKHQPHQFEVFLPQTLMGPDTLAAFQRERQGSIDTPESLKERNQRVIGLRVTGLWIFLVNFSQTLVTVSQDNPSANPYMGRLCSQVATLQRGQTEGQLAERKHMTCWHVHMAHGQLLGSPQSAASRTAAINLQQHATPFEGTVAGYDPHGLILAGPGFSGWLMEARMQPKLLQRQRMQTAVGVVVLDDAFADEPPAAMRNADARLRSARAMGAASMVGERLTGLYVMRVAVCELGRDYQQTGIWLTQNPDDVASSQELLPSLPATCVADQWSDMVSAWRSPTCLAIVHPACPTAWEARALPMGKDSIKRMAAAFQMCDSQQPFSGRIVGHCSRGILIFGLGITGLLEVANFSEEVAAAQLAAQRQCRLEMGLWALKFNHDHMIEIALDTLIGRRLQGLMLAEVVMPHGELLLEAAPGQTISFVTALSEAATASIQPDGYDEVMEALEEGGMSRERMPKRGEKGFAGWWHSAVTFLRGDSESPAGPPEAASQMEPAQHQPTLQDLAAASEASQTLATQPSTQSLKENQQEEVQPAEVLPPPASSSAADAGAAEVQEQEVSIASQKQEDVGFWSRAASPAAAASERDAPLRAGTQHMSAGMQLLLSQQSFEGRVVKYGTSGVYVKDTATAVHGFLPLAHLDPRVALPVIRQELAHANSFKQAGFGTWDSMGSVLRLRALESLQRPTLAGLRVFMVASGTSRKDKQEDVLVSQILDTGRLSRTGDLSSTMEDICPEDDANSLALNALGASDHHMYQYLRSQWPSQWGSADLRNKLGDLQEAQVLSQKLTAAQAVEWVALGRRYQVQSFAIRPRVHALDRAFPDKSGGNEPIRHLREQPLGAARSRNFAGIVTHGLLLHHGVDAQDLWAVTSMSLQSTLWQANKIASEQLIESAN